MTVPAGTLTFLFTDIEGSTRLLHRLKDAYADVLLECRRLLRAAIQERGGQEVDTEGDALFAAFTSAREAVLAAVTAQRRILRHPWPDAAAVRIRMGVHTGEARIAEAGYVGMDVHRAARIGAAGHGGQVLVSGTTAALIRTDLPEGVGVRDLGEHRLRDFAHPERLFQVVAGDLPAVFPPLRTTEVLPNNLPVQLTSFIGREREKADIKRLFAATRLLVLTGSGGAGKTRLALEVAGELLDQYPDGVWVAELAALSEATLVPQVVANVLGMRDESGRPVLAVLADYLRSKHLLLVLDSCEHVLPACAHLVDPLLRACPKLRVLATSREALGIGGELAYRVPSLSLPEERHTAVEQQLHSEAVRLFVERAAFSQPEFRITPANAAAVVHVCRRLDGLPLAIELAAARVKALAVEQIAARLDDRFRLLSGGSRIALPRHQTLRATIDWSYALLADVERVLLRRLSVFAGGFDLEAAESVCAGNGVEAAAALEVLARLVDKSLVLAEERRGGNRYRLLETVRQYGAEKFAEAGEADGVRTRHLDWCLALAERAEPELRGQNQRRWVQRLDLEHDNLRAALAWSHGQADGPDRELRLAGALTWFWLIRGHWTEGRRWLELALEREAQGRPLSIAKALHGAAFFAWRHNDIERAQALGERGVAVARELGDPESLTYLLIDLGVTAIRRADLGRAEALFGEALTLARSGGDRWFLMHILGQMGVVARNAGDYDRARSLHEEALAHAQAAGDTFMAAYQLRNLGMDALRQGHAAESMRFFIEGLQLSTEFGTPWLMEECLEGFAGVAGLCGDGRRAAVLFAAAEKQREILGHARSKFDRADFDGRVASIRHSLGSGPFQAAWAAGQAMTLDQAIEYAVSGKPEHVPVTGTATRDGKASGGFV